MRINVVSSVKSQCSMCTHSICQDAGRPCGVLSPATSSLSPLFDRESSHSPGRTGHPSNCPWFPHWFPFGTPSSRSATLFCDCTFLRAACFLHTAVCSQKSTSPECLTFYSSCLPMIPIAALTSTCSSTAPRRTPSSRAMLSFPKACYVAVHAAYIFASLELIAMTVCSLLQLRSRCSP